MTRAWAGALLAVALSWASPAAAQQRWAVVLSGASGGAKYAEQMQQWRTALQATLVDRYGFDKAHVTVLTDEADKAGMQGTAANVRSVFANIRKQAAADDLVLVVLLGHGTYDGEVAKFNLVGPDLSAEDWAGLLNGLPGRLVLVNTTEASFPFIERLSSRGRVVITATDSAAQKYATVFPEYFVKALSEASTDLDKNGRTSVHEVFEAVSLAVKQHYEQRGQLPTERPMLDDNGDKVGRLAGAEGPDGAIARQLHLDADAADAAANPELAALLKQRRELEAAVEAHKLKKGEMPDTMWQVEFERLVLELARVSRQIREKS